MSSRPNLEPDLPPPFTLPALLSEADLATAAAAAVAVQERDREPLEWAIDHVSVTVHIGCWRGRKKISETQTRPEQPLLLFAKDDEEPHPWGRALEELLTELLRQVRAGG